MLDDIIEIIADLFGSVIDSFRNVRSRRASGPRHSRDTWKATKPPVNPATNYRTRRAGRSY